MGIVAVVAVLVIAVIIIAVVVGVFVHRQKMHKQKVQQGLFLAGAISDHWRSNKKHVSIVPEMGKKVNEEWLTEQARKANRHDLRVGEALKWKGRGQSKSQAAITPLRQISKREEQDTATAAAAAAVVDESKIQEQSPTKRDQAP